MKLEMRLPKDKTIFLDRGIPDTIAYYKLYGFDTQEILKTFKGKRYKKIFFLEPVKFEKDYARTEDEIAAIKLGDLIKEAYINLGYAVINVPIMSVDERVKFILSNL